MSFKQNFKDMLSSDGKISSKRVITFVAFICVVIAFFVNLLFTIVVDTTILNAMVTIVYAGLGVTVGEHLLKKRTFNSHSDRYSDRYSESYESNSSYNSYRSDNDYHDDDYHHHDDEILGDN